MIPHSVVNANVMPPVGRLLLVESVFSFETDRGEVNLDAHERECYEPGREGEEKGETHANRIVSVKSGGRLTPRDTPCGEARMAVSGILQMGQISMQMTFGLLPES